MYYMCVQCNVKDRKSYFNMQYFLFYKKAQYLDEFEMQFRTKEVMSLKLAKIQEHWLLKIPLSLLSQKVILHAGKHAMQIFF